MMNTVIEIVDEAEDVLELVEESITLAGSLRIINSDESYDETVSTDDSPHTVPDTAVTPVNSNGDAIGTPTDLPSGKPGVVVADDVTHTDSDLTPVVLPAGVPMVCTVPAPCPSSVISIDSVPIETLSSGAGLDLSVELDGNPVTPTYDYQTKTIGVTSVPCPRDLTIEVEVEQAADTAPITIKTRSAGTITAIDWGGLTGGVVEVNNVVVALPFSVVATDVVGLGFDTASADTAIILTGTY